MIRTLGLLGLAAVALDRCQAGGPSEAGEPRVEFDVVGAAPEAKDRPASVDSVAPGEITVTGAMSTPTPCHVIGADLALRDRTLALTLTASGQPGICIQMLAAFEYRARIYGVRPGRYTLEVSATYPGSGWESRVERLEVQVP